MAAPPGLRSLMLAANFLYLSGSEIASKLVTFAAITYLARVAGPVGFGYVEFAAAVLLCASLMVDQGFGPYGAREIAKAPHRTAALVSEIVTARAVLAVFAYAAVLAFALLLTDSAIVTQLLLIYGLSLLAMPLLLQWVFQGHNRMRTVAAIQLIRQTVFALVVFALVREQSQIWVAAMGEALGVGGAAAYGVWTYRRQLGGKLQTRLKLSRRLFGEGVPIGLSQTFWMVRMFGATVIVGLLASPQDVGFFGGAMRILVALHAFVWLYFFNLLPSLAHKWQEGDGTFSTLIARSLQGVAWITVIAGFGWVLAAPAVMRGVYGPAFDPAGVTLQWLAGVFVIAALSGHYRHALIAAGHQRSEMVISALGAMIAVALIPIGYRSLGPSGAAMGLLTAEFVVWWSAWWWARERLGLDGHLRLLIRPTIAAVLTLALLWLLPLNSEAARILLVVAATLALAFVLDGAVRERLRWVAGVWLPSARARLRSGPDSLVKRPLR